MNIAVLTGGTNTERDIAIKSAKNVAQALAKTGHDIFVLVLDEYGCFCGDALVDLNDFSVFLDDEQIQFDVVYPVVHGSPIEDGQLQGYFDYMGIPYTGSNGFASALTFDKAACKRWLVDQQIPMAKSLLITDDSESTLQQIKGTLQFPLFVKSNAQGSSYGVSKVDRFEDLKAAINVALEYDDAVLAEEFIDGVEVSCGVYQKDGEILALPVTEIRPKADFFDYKAKYEGASDEITPAEISDQLTKAVQHYSVESYKILGASGIARVDFIIQRGIPYFLEINTNPGMSDASIIPQQVAAAKLDLSEFLFQPIIEVLSVYK